MFGIFKKKTPEQLAIRELKRLRKSISKEGGAEKLCYRFWKYLESNSLYTDTGIVLEEDAPYSKIMVIMASLDLLNSWKGMPDDDPDIKELIKQLSKRVYIAGVLTLNHDEMAALHKEVGGTPGLITVDAERASEIEHELTTEIKKRIISADEAWHKWKESDFNILDAIKNA